MVTRRSSVSSSARRIGLEVLLFELGEDERVDRSLHPGLVLDRRHRRLFHRLEGPIILLRGREDVRRLGWE